MYGHKKQMSTQHDAEALRRSEANARRKKLERETEALQHEIYMDHKRLMLMAEKFRFVVQVIGATENYGCLSLVGDILLIFLLRLLRLRSVNIVFIELIRYDW